MTLSQQTETPRKVWPARHFGTGDPLADGSIFNGSEDVMPFSRTVKFAAFSHKGGTDARQRNLQ